MNWSLTPAGDRAFIVDFTPPSRHEGVGGALAFAEYLRSVQLVGVEDVVPSQHAVLVVLRGARDYQSSVAAATDVLGSWEAQAVTAHSRPTVRVPVRYDGPDLADVAAASGLSVDELIQAHTARPWTAAFSGFMPGFCYLLANDAEGDLGQSRGIRAARRSEPRAKVPQGAVAVAGPYSAVYPRQGPGGWQLLGTTSMPMWDLQADPPATITPGCLVQFVAVDPASAPRGFGPHGP